MTNPLRQARQYLDRTKWMNDARRYTKQPDPNNNFATKCFFIRVLTTPALLCSQRYSEGISLAPKEQCWLKELT
jgi:hypothetical protein